MKYINKKTQAVIDTVCEISGGDWVKVEEQPKKTSTKPKTAKKSGDK